MTSTRANTTLSKLKGMTGVRGANCPFPPPPLFPPEETLQAKKTFTWKLPLATLSETYSYVSHLPVLRIRTFNLPDPTYQNVQLRIRVRNILQDPDQTEFLQKIAVKMFFF